MRFLADESCDFAVVRALRENGHDVLDVAEVARGAKRLTRSAARARAGPGLAEGKDFGWYGLGFDQGCQELGGVLQVIVGDEAGLCGDQLVEDLSAEVELLLFRVLAGLGLQGQVQELADVAGAASLAR